MGQRLKITYDQIGDFLFLDVCRPYPEQDSNEIDSAIVARFNPKTGEIETLEILFFESRLKLDNEIRIPVTATLQPANKPAHKPATTNTPITIKYNHPTDTLTINQRHPHPSQTKTQLTKGISARTNPATNQIENLEIQNFKARLKTDNEIILPINATLRPIKHAAAPN